ncbi:MAG: putative outer membrane zinc-dependent metalloprotease [Bacteroidetes bacterium]|nr:MAG: putative outer membrane zinc-dependent metalloprotease [Bacteroidota bacterium]
MKKIICSVPVLAITALASAQSSSPDVIASGGDFFTGSTFTNSYTIGEMAMVETFTGSNYILTQGFQQPDDFSTGISQLTAGSGLSIFPNPSNGNFSLQAQLDKDATVKIEIYDVLGKLLFTESQVAGLGVFKKDLNLTSFESGVYFVRFTTESGQKQITTTQPITITR